MTSSGDNRYNVCGLDKRYKLTAAKECHKNLSAVCLVKRRVRKKSTDCNQPALGFGMNNIANYALSGKDLVNDFESNDEAD